MTHACPQLGSFGISVTVADLRIEQTCMVTLRLAGSAVEARQSSGMWRPADARLTGRVNSEIGEAAEQVNHPT
jgi:hypothetical protein